MHPAKTYDGQFDVASNYHGSITQYLGQFVHNKCGGTPVLSERRLKCSACKEQWPWEGTLGFTMEQLIKRGTFRRLEVLK